MVRGGRLVNRLGLGGLVGRLGIRVGLGLALALSVGISVVDRK